MAAAGHPLDTFGNKLPTPTDPVAHIPLGNFTFRPECVPVTRVVDELIEDALRELADEES